MPLVYQVPHISITHRADIASFKASAQITLGVHTSAYEEVLRTGLTEIEGGRNCKFRTSNETLLYMPCYPPSVSWGELKKL